MKAVLIVLGILMLTTLVAAPADAIIVRVSPDRWSIDCDGSGGCVVQADVVCATLGNSGCQ